LDAIHAFGHSFSLPQGSSGPKQLTHSAGMTSLLAQTSSAKRTRIAAQKVGGTYHTRHTPAPKKATKLKKPVYAKSSLVKKRKRVDDSKDEEPEDVSDDDSNDRASDNEDEPSGEDDPEVEYAYTKAMGDADRNVSNRHCLHVASHTHLNAAQETSPP
ncbi:MAG: hypothetical protein ACREHG_09575, partial [Candidatus Saccharimonadales bacterium]